MAAFAWWMNTSNSDALQVIGGDSNLPEKKLIIKALERKDFACLMLETRKNLIDSIELMGLVEVIYKKVSPFCHTQYRPSASDIHDRQSILSLLTLYNICHVVMEGKEAASDKVSFQLEKKLDDNELMLFSKNYSALKSFFSEVFEDDKKDLFQAHKNHWHKENILIDQVVVFTVILLVMSACVSYTFLESMNSSMVFLGTSLALTFYLYFMRAKSFSTAIEDYVIKIIQKF